MSLELDPRPILEKALAHAGQWSELFLEESSSLMVVMDNGEVEKVIAGLDRGAGLRLIHQSRTAYAHANDLDPKILAGLAADLSEMAQGPKGAPKPLSKAPALYHSRAVTPPQDVGTARKVDMVRAAEAAARAHDPRIRQVRMNYLDRVQMVRVAGSHGREAWDQRLQVIMAVHCVAEDKGLVQTGYEVAGGSAGLELLEQPGPEALAVQAAARAVLMLEADPAPGGSMPVVIHADAGGTMIHEAVGHGLEADHVNEGMSVYAGRLGQAVASPLVSVVDDATLAGKRGTFGYDDEGVAGRRNLLIEAGVLKGYLHDRLSAQIMGAEPTGNGRRESYRFRPVPRMANTMILSGEDDPQSIISQTPEGLLVKKMGGGQVNTVNGDFVFEVSEGYLIKGGKIGAPVRGATLTGNGPKVLTDIDRVASDLGFSLGTCGKDGQGAPVADAQPTLRIPSMVVGGQHNG